MNVGGRVGTGPSVRVEAEEEEEWEGREEKRDTLRPGAMGVDAGAGWRESTGTIMGNRASVATVTDSNRYVLFPQSHSTVHPSILSSRFALSPALRSGLLLGQC